MSDPQGPRDEALRRFDERYEALSAKTRRPAREMNMESGAGAAYTLIGELVGGVLVGLGFGWLLDRFAHTTPFGLIGGMLLGMVAAIIMVVRSAGRMADQAKLAVPPDTGTGPVEPGPEEG